MGDSGVGLEWELWVLLLLELVLSAEVREDTGTCGMLVACPHRLGDPEVDLLCALTVPHAMSTITSSSGLGACTGFGRAAGS